MQQTSTILKYILPSPTLPGKVHPLLDASHQLSDTPAHQDIPSQHGGHADFAEGIAADNGDQLQRHLGSRQSQLIAIGGSIGTALFVSIGNGLYHGGYANFVEGIAGDNADQLQRHLGSRQSQLIAIGGSIGTALFVSIGHGLYHGGHADFVEGIAADSGDQLQRHLGPRQTQLIAIGGSIGTVLLANRHTTSAIRHTTSSITHTASAIIHQQYNTSCHRYIPQHLARQLSDTPHQLSAIPHRLSDTLHPLFDTPDWLSDILRRLLDALHLAHQLLDTPHRLLDTPHRLSAHLIGYQVQHISHHTNHIGFQTHYSRYRYRHISLPFLAGTGMILLVEYKLVEPNKYISPFAMYLRTCIIYFSGRFVEELMHHLELNTANWMICIRATFIWIGASTRRIQQLWRERYSHSSSGMEW